MSNVQSIERVNRSPGAERQPVLAGNQFAQEGNRLFDVLDGAKGAARSRLRSRAGLVGESAEDLACPSCRATWRFGDVCPTCDVLLVSESLVDVVEPEMAPARGWSIPWFQVICACAVVGLTALWFV